VRFLHKINACWDCKAVFESVLHRILLSRSDKSCLTPFILRRFSDGFLPALTGLLLSVSSAQAATVRQVKFPMVMIRLFLFACLATLATGAQAVTYANKSIPFSWINTSSHAHVGYNTSPYKMNSTIAPGTRCGTTPPVLDDTISDDIPFGFNFNYGGVVFTSARIMSNGRLQFNNNTACGYGSPVTQLPYVYYSSATNNLNYSMRIYGNDLDPTPQANAGYSTACKLTSTCYMSYASIGTAPNRQFVVTWNNIPEWAAGGSTSGNYNLQVILNEDGTFVYQYGSDTPGPQAPLAQVGWQVSQIDYDIPNVGLPVNNSAILFYIPSPVAQYHFQQSAWTAAGQVLDTNGGSTTYDGTALGAATPGVGYVCNGAVIPNNTKTNTIDAIDTGITVPTVLGGVGTIDFWYQANAAWIGGGDAQLLDASISQNEWFFVVKRNNGDLRFVVTDSNGTLHAAETAANNIPAGTWTHIALTWDFNALAGSNKDHLSIYINGTQVKLLTFTTSGTVSSSIGTLYLGDNRSSHTGSNGTGNSANGTLDEVNIYNFEGGTGLIQRDMNYMATCSGPDHIRVQHDGNGLTCTPETLTVIACADAACTAPNYTASSVTGNVTWAGTPGGSVPFNITASGTTTVSLPVTTPQTVTLGTSAVSPAAISASDCWDTGTASASCSLLFADSGLLLSAPNQTAETVAALTVQAVKKADNSLVCVPAFANVAKTVNLKCAYSNPATGTLPVRVGGTALNAAANTAAACDATGANVSLNFDATGTATPSLQYADVGQMNLTASYTGIAGSPDAGLSMTGATSFIAAPASFAFSGVTAGSIKAGNPFSVTVSALNNAGAVTPNFGKETPAAGVTLTSSLVTPDPVTYPSAANPVPGNNVIPGTEFGAGGMVADASGVATINNLSWGEVGSITLSANLTSTNGYLGTAGTPTKDASNNILTASGTSATIGAFIPDHFDTAVVPSVTLPMPCPTGLTCPASFNGFVYSGQAFRVQVIARNLAGGTTTNYSSVYGLANSVAMSAWDALGSLVAPTGSGVLANSTMAASSFVSGVGLDYTQAYTFDASPTAPTDIFLRAVDATNTTVTSRRAVPATSVEGGVKVVSGKIMIPNAYGSELLPLPLTVTVQYWENSDWVTSATDDVTQFDTNLSTAGGNIVVNILTGLAGGVSVATPGVVTVTGGANSFTLNAPSVPGSADISLNVPDYLLAGSNGAGVNPSDPARVTFGIFKGSEHVIYLREVY
jgi:MSHA biogenesis protein MshQ